MPFNVEIGCSGNPQPGYIHCDRFFDRSNHADVDVVCDAAVLPFGDGLVDSVLMFGVFEHFGYFEVQEVLLEVSRVLREGGSFKFDVPDFNWFLERYLHPELLEDGRTEEWVLHSLFGWQRHGLDFHRWGWSKRRLEDFLRKPNWNFIDVRFLGRQWRDPESNHLIYECKKGDG